MSQRKRLRRANRAGITVAALAIAACITLAGCTSGTGKGGTASDSNRSTGAPSNGGGTANIGILEPRDVIYPGKYLGGEGVVVIQALFAPLVSMNPSGTPSMVAAQSVTTTDNQVWTIKIKPWKFQDGEPITAQNYVDTMNAAAYGPNQWGQNFRLAEVEGYSALNPAKGSPTTKTLTGVKAVDQDTFQITLTAPDSQFIYNLSFDAGPYMPLPEQAFSDPKIYADHPIGNGPFQMSGNWQHNQLIKVTHWTGFEGTQPKIDGINFKIYTQSNAAFSDLQAGNLDIMGVSGLSVPSEDLPLIKSTFKDHSYLGPANDSVWLTFPSWDTSFSDIRVRQAISQSIDRPTIASKLLSDTVTPATGLLLPSDIGGSTKACGDSCNYNPAQAKQLLAQAGGWSSGTMTIYDLGYPDGVAQAIANNIRQNLGITVTIQSIQFAALQQLNDKHQLKGPFLMNWGNVVPTPSDMYNSIFASTALNNWVAGGYRSQDVDNLVKQAAQTSDTDQQTTLYHQTEAIILNAFWVAPLYWGGYPAFFSNRVTHFTYDSNNEPDYYTLTLGS
jgi:oligopeptide transport system substrate-binding protein